MGRPRVRPSRRRVARGARRNAGAEPGALERRAEADKGRGARERPRGRGGERLGVSHHFVEPTVTAILAAARTGEVGDGKVFVLPVEKVYRIRTGEEDQAAVTPVPETVTA